MRWSALSPLFTANLREALGDPVGATAFVVGVVAAALGDRDGRGRTGPASGPPVQVHRNLLASSLRFPMTAVLLALGLTDAHVLQVCWVLPLVVSVPFALWRLRLAGADRRQTGARPCAPTSPRTVDSPFVTTLSACRWPLRR